MAKAYPEYLTQNDLVGRIVKAMSRKGYLLFTNPGEVNIAYVEGLNPDGTANDNKPNVFNDLRTTFTFRDNVPVLLGKWEGTTEPSKYWTEHPMQPGGAARVQFGQYTSWQVGIHNGSHEALVQTGGPITITRDRNYDYKRDNDPVQTGFYGINQHWGYDLPHDNMANSSAGCLVGRTKQGHREFMSIIKADPRYKANDRFIFTSCILPASDVT